MKSELWRTLLPWYDRNKRDLPWRHTRDPYRIWLSEIMLQQTRVETVKAYYQRFLALFPTAAALADAEEAQVLKAWEGLGYYSRARNLHLAMGIIAGERNGVFPASYEELLRLPGVGVYTAGAIASNAFGERVPAVDGNVCRVIARVFGVRENVAFPAVQRRIRALAARELPEARPGDFNQALMELGATLCSPLRPQCCRCPLRERCDAYGEGDAELLPVHEKKKPQKAVSMAVCLLTCGDRVLVTRRTQRLLKGLYVFLLIEEEPDPVRLGSLLEEAGLSCSPGETVTTARHVFTHLIWDMTIFRYTMKEPPAPMVLEALGGRMVNREELAALAMPAAMKAARSAANRLLEADAGGVSP